MYTQFYHFSEKPFELTPDPKFIYYSPSHREALASMIYGISERKGFISVTGEVGTGKTTLIYTLLNNLSEKVKPVFIFHTTVSFEHFLISTLLELDVPVENEDKPSLLQQLNEYLTQRMSPEETLAIIIDEAQNLPQETLEEFRMLSNIETSKVKLLQILLVGQPELETKLNSEGLRQLKQRIGIRRHLQPLTPGESKEYIEHRLNIVGSSTSSTFTPGAVSKIVRYARGIPRTINILCDNALLIGYSLSQKKIDEKIVDEVIKDMGEHTEYLLPSTRDIALPSPTKSIITFFVIIAFVFSLLFFLLSTFFPRETSDRRTMVQLKEVPPTSSPAKTTEDSISPITTSLEERISSDEKLLPGVPPVSHLETAAQEETPPLPSQSTTPQEEVPLPEEQKSGQCAALKPKETLYSLALKYYQKADETLFDLILRANPALTNVREIPPNREIIIPAITPESYLREEMKGTYQVHAGTFETPALANAFVGRLGGLPGKITIQAHTFSPKDTWYRVLLEGFTSQDEALRAITLLKERGLIYLP